jgi:hypothetical protein
MKMKRYQKYGEPGASRRVLPVNVGVFAQIRVKIGKQPDASLPG